MVERKLVVQDDPEGVGLAAAQIGKNVQIFLINFEGTEKIIINPKVISKSKIKGKSTKGRSRLGGKPLEGCLSLPHYYGPIKRANKIKIKFLDEKGKTKVEEFRGFLAQIVQHELDHLNGILFVDRILEQDSNLFEYNKGEWEEVELE